MNENNSFSFLSFTVGAIVGISIMMGLELVDQRPWDPQPRKYEVNFDAEMQHRERDVRDHFIDTLRKEIDSGNDEMIDVLRKMHDQDYPEFVGE